MSAKVSGVPGSEISVVIQGPLYPQLGEAGLAGCLDSVRRTLPDAEIVVSTWLHEDVSGVDGCVVVQSPEPPTFEDVNGNRNNLLRQIVSTRRGLAAASRPRVLKLRADHRLCGTALLLACDYREEVPPERRLFGSRIVVTNLFLRDPSRIPMLFHLSDLVQFGRREDLLDLWGGGGDRLPEYEDLYAGEPSRRVLGNFTGYTNLRVLPEQFLALDWLRRHGWAYELPAPCHVDSRLLPAWEEALADNFHVVDWRRSGVRFPPRFFAIDYAPWSVYSGAAVAALARRGGRRPRLRRAHVWLAQYVLCWGRINWWLRVASVVLFSLSPRLAVALRERWRRAMRSGRV